MADDSKILDDKTLQRLLFISSDIIGEAINRKGQNLGNRVVRLNASANDSMYLNEKQQIDVLKRQHSILSDSAVSVPQVAYDLFSDEVSTSPIDTNYSISNFILIFFGTTPYYFNIDEVNYNNKKIFFSKLNIVNKSKDAFTAKSDYKISLKINFTTYDDLIEQNITVKNAYNPKEIINISPLHLLYKFFDQKIGSQEEKEVADPTGIFLTQTIQGKGSRFNFLSSGFNGTISKNYHLTFHKHNIEMFKNEEPIFKYFENEMTIEYIAYEADGIDKPIPSAMQKIIPRVNGNLYNLLDTKVLADTQLSWSTAFGDTRTDKDGRVIESNIIYGMSDIIGKFKKINADIEKLQEVILKCDATTVAGRKKEDLQEKINELTEQLKTLKTYANRSLIFTIMRLCRLYRIMVPVPVVGIYEKNMFLENFQKNFNGGALATELTIGAATGGGAGIAVSALFYFVGLTIESYEILNVRKDLDVTLVRSEVTKITSGGLAGPGEGDFSEEHPEKFLQLAQGKNIGNSSNNPQQIDTGMDSTKDFAVLKTTSEESSKKMKTMMENLGLQEIPTGDIEQQKAVIFFTTFGEIIKLLTFLDPSGELRIVSGGYLMNIDGKTGDAVYNNFTTIPITINALSQFLYRMIDESDRSLQYDSEVFFRDCYENLIKSVINDGQLALPSLQNAAPTNIKVVSTLHNAYGNNNYNKWFKNTNLLSETDFQNFLTHFTQTKNFNLHTNGIEKNTPINKIYVIATHNEIKYYDFYESYEQWIELNKSKNSKIEQDKFVYNSRRFQEFINKEHLMPCVLMRNVSDSESILKKKYVNFSRIDNANLNTGNFQNKFGQLRYPYQFKADFKIFISFFIDIGSLIFISPPLSFRENQINSFGFGGLYVIKSAELEYFFQRIQDGNITIPNFESKYTLEGSMISHGDSIRNRNRDRAAEAANKDKTICNEAAPVSGAPADA